MPSLSYGIGAFDRATGNLPDLTCINLYAESARTSEGRICLQSRPGLTTLATNGSGPINAIFSNRGSFDGDDFTVSGTTLYRGTTSIGAMSSLASSGEMTMAGADTEVLVARPGGRLYSYDGTDLVTAFTVGNDTNNVRAVAFIGSLFVAIEDNSGRVYWSTPLDGRAWDALDFFTAERAPDNLLDLAALNDKLLLYGQDTVEVWAHTGDASLPFTRIEGIGSQVKGIMGTGCKAEADNTFFHIGSDGVVYRFAEAFERISDHWLEEKITTATAWKMFSFKLHGHEFICVRLNGTGGNTYAYDAATREWCEFQTDGGQWIASCAAMKGTTVYLGNQTDGKIMGFSGWADLADTLERRFTAATPLDVPLSIDDLRIWANVGHAPTGVTPTVSLRYSRDAGNTWSSYIDIDLGNATDDGNDDYRIRPQWRRLGMFDDPGALFEIKTTAAIPFRVSAVKINEPGGGRSRA